jgi:hypothetical protein
MKKIIALFLFSVFISSCSVQMDDEEIHGLLFEYKSGLIAGVQIGDSWEIVKSNARDGWTIRDEPGFYQYRKDWDQGNDMMMVTFYLDESKNVIGMEFSMTAMTNNYPQMDLLKKKFISDFNLIMATKQTNNWEYLSDDGDFYSIVITELEPVSDRKRFDIMISK